MHRSRIAVTLAVAASTLFALGGTSAHAYTISGTYFSGTYSSASGSRFYRGYVREITGRDPADPNDLLVLSLAVRLDGLPDAAPSTD